ncbi:MAG TPA: threonine synthase [Casimicrobiaceae bacterium]|nr:threonine synthase [Casimicrobiaceae bacterium]
MSAVAGTRYVSTRGAWRDAPQPFCAILLEGLAPDGGLAVPDRYPAFAAGELDALAGAPYRTVAYAVLSKFIGDIPGTDLRALIDRTYTAEAFGSDAVVPLAWLEPGLALLRTSNGPTLAFKDIALQLLGGLFEYALAREGRRITILGATSGDTGSSAEVALRGRRGIDVFMLSPHGRMSAFQQAQMFSLDEPNIHNLAVDGTFDDCQDLVKAVAGDAAFKRRYAIGAVNSINWARIAAQVVYYVHGWLEARAAPGAPVDVAVPSGNFGNILAAHVAKRMGVPLRRLILATNENDVLDEFFRTGRYRVRGGSETHATSSPSMDISKASNFERFVFDALGRDAARTRALFAEVETRRAFTLTAAERERIAAFGFVSGRSTAADRLATIRDVHARIGEVIDPHTADALKVARERRDPATPMIVLETALAAKFNATIRAAIGRDAPRPARLAGLEELPQRVVAMPADVERLKSFIADNDRR